MSQQSDAVSVCMIVRNEESNLRPCLESMGDLPFEIIVVDTGSADRTVQVAQALGARVYHFPWTEDFSAARNESLRHATGNWVFWLDADDRLDPGAVLKLKQTAGLGEADAYLCMVRSRESDGRQNTVEHIRLFRNDLGIRFDGPIHETVLPDLVRLGLRVASTDIMIEHTGYYSEEEIRRKTNRNIAIIERQLAVNPDRIDLMLYRGQARSNLGDMEGAEADMLDYLTRTRPVHQFDYHRFWAYSVLGRIQQKRADVINSEAILRQALTEFPEHPHFLHLLAQLHLMQGKEEQAILELLSALTALAGTIRGLQPSEAWLQMGLAEAYSATGDIEEALRWARQAKLSAPPSIAFGELLGRILIDSGRQAEAEAWLTEVLHAIGSGLPEMTPLSADGSMDSRAEQMLQILKGARLTAATPGQPSSVSQPSQSQLRGLGLLSSGEYLKAAECFGAAIESQPSTPENYRYLGIALQKLGRDEEALEAWRLAQFWSNHTPRS